MTDEDRLAQLRVALGVAAGGLAIGGVAAVHEVLALVSEGVTPSAVAHAGLVAGLVALGWATLRASRLYPARSPGPIGDEPPEQARAWIVVLCSLWVVAHAAIPLRYYLGDDEYDERFAWRMFSAVRVQSCEVAITELRGATRTPLPIMQHLPAPWASLLERNRPAVIDRFLTWRCAEAEVAPDEVRVTSSCTSVGGERLPARVRVVTCATGALRDEAPDGDGDAR